LTGCADRTIRLFNPSSGSLIQTYSAHGYEVVDLDIAADNSKFVSCGGDKTIFLWDVASATTIRRFSGHAAKVEGVAFGGDDEAGSSVVVSGSFDGTVRVWDVKSQSSKPLMTLSEAKDGITSVKVAGWDIFAGSIDGRVRTYDIRMGKAYVDTIGYAVTCVSPTKQNDSVLVSSLDSTIRLMDRRDGKCLQAFKDWDYENKSHRLRSTLGLNDAVVISGSEDGQIFVWDLLEGNVIHRLKHGDERAAGHGTSRSKRTVSAVAFCPARKEWASAGGDGKLFKQVKYQKCMLTSPRHCRHLGLRHLRPSKTPAVNLFATLNGRPRHYWRLSSPGMRKSMSAAPLR
jgi:mitogen-activated protein kinase organizer 1